MSSSEPLPLNLTTLGLLSPEIYLSNQAVLLIGGPGQGKSTLCQLACQSYRAVLMRPYHSKLSEKQWHLVQSFLMPAEATDFPVPDSGCLPLQIILPDFIAWSAQQTESENSANQPALIRFLAARAVAREAGLSVESLLALVGKMPSLVVLDGFDEVGAAADRAALVVAIRELFAYLRVNAVPVKVLATTRPQGYADELAKVGIPLAETNLLPLDVREATRYAEKLIIRKYPDADKKTGNTGPDATGGSRACHSALAYHAVAGHDFNLPAGENWSGTTRTMGVVP